MSTTSSNIWKEGEMILKGEVGLSDSMQLCLDGNDPDDCEDYYLEKENANVSTEIEDIPSIIGTRGLRGVENYLNVKERKNNTNTENANREESIKMPSIGSENNSTEMNMSTSYAETVSALLKSPQPILFSTLNKENINGAYSEEINLETETSGLKTARKRSLTEMIGHNPLSKETKPLGQKRCFETDL